ncbi:MAG: enoyl-CoA hydratase/isomerase family protein [Deltaproteobacteria bacterium]|nr:enoyl-CoA hydratase/isomerase family protein [Deltaproteobacteria bacterium]
MSNAGNGGPSPAQRWQTLETERDGAILRVWLARPARRNALDTTALEEIAALFAGLQRDYATRVVVLGGRGVSFCAGADRRSPPGRERMAVASGAGGRERRQAAQIGLRACRAIEECEVVTIARIHGHAVGGGLALALACDFRIAAEDTVFSIPEVDLGIPLGWGASARLVHEIGAARAREAILLCERFDARRAEAWGALHRAVPAAELDAVVEDWARRLAAKPELAVHMTKTQLRAYALAARLGDVTENDGDLLAAASREEPARRAFPSE